MSKDEERLEFLKSYENKLIAEGTKLIVGIDEAGRGPLAGPVSVATVIMKPESNLKWVNDSKKVTEKRREILYDQIIEDAIVWDVEIVTQSEIDEYNILEATKIGLNRCIKKIIDKLGKKPELILVDALKEIDTCGVPYQSIVKGDATCYSISCASILAKVTRDRLMREYSEIYPQYGFEKNKGYGTKAHIDAIKEFGPCSLHRKTFITHFV